jgi:hypothetical protein
LKNQSIVILLIFLFKLSISNAQDSLKVKLDSLKVPSESKFDTLRGQKLKSSLSSTKKTLGQAFGTIDTKPEEVPKIAFVRSLLLPGWGQITNKQYYKLPFIYGSAAAGIYFIHTNNQKFKEFKGYLVTMNDSKTTEILINERGPYSYSIVNTAAKQYRRWKQGTVIGFSLGWLLFAVESNVSAHLKTFDISDDISLKMKPTVFSVGGKNALGLNLNINIK